MSVLRSDNFDRADGYPSNTPSDGLGDYVIGNVGVSSGQGSSYLYYGSACPAGLECGTADVSASVTLMATWDYGQPVGVALRINGTSFIALAAQSFGASLSIQEYATNGSATAGTLLADCGTHSYADVITLTAVGDEYRAYKNGVLVGSVSGVTTNQSVTVHGFFCGSFSERNSVDDLLIESVDVTPPTSSTVLISDWW